MNGATREMTHKELKEAYRELVIKLDKIREVIDERADTSPYHFKPLPYYFKTIKSILESED